MEERALYQEDYQSSENRDSQYIHQGMTLGYTVQN